jgi:molybdopterin-guanine dinucleotide biosynthesis protein A
MGEAKALLDWHGEPLVHHVAGVLTGICAPVIVVAAAGQELPLPEGVEIAVDAAPERGPLEGVAAGIRRLDGRAEAVFLAAVDLPLLHPAFVRQMLAALPGFDAAVAVSDGRDQPLAAAYVTGLLERAPALLAAGEARVTALLEHGRIRRLTVAELAEPDSLRTANTPADYRRLLALPLRG